MKRNPFISRLATRVAAVALTIGAAFSFSACSDDDEVDNSGSFKTRLEVPVVAAFNQSDATTHTLKFKWEAVEEATHYMAQIRLSETGDIFQEKQLQTTEVSFVGLNDDTEYYFRVSAQYTYDEGRNSAYSQWVVGKTVMADPTRPTLAVPANPMCDKSKTTASTLTFGWESVEHAAAYNVVLTAIGEEDYTATTTETTYTFVGLKKGVKYFFTVQAAEVDGYNASDFTGQINATTTDQLPTPTNLDCKVKMSEAAQFAWDPVQGAVTYGYELTTITAAGETVVMEGLLSELNPDEIIPGQTVSATTTNTTMTFRGLEKDTYYAFRVKAVAAEGSTSVVDSEFTDYYVIKTLVTDATPLAAPAITVDELQQFKIFLSWAPVAGALGYDFQFASADAVAAGDESAYRSGELRPVVDEITGETTPVETLMTLSNLGEDAAGNKIALVPDTEYKVRMKTVADPANPTDGDSAWTEWLTVKTAPLADALTFEPGDDITDMLERVQDGAVITLKAGQYNTAAQFNIVKNVTIQGASATDRPKVNFNRFILHPDKACSKVRIANIEFTNYKLNADGTLASDYLGQYFLDNSGQGANVETLEIENCVVWGGFKSAFIRMNRTNFGVDNLLVKDNIVCIGGSDGALASSNGKPFGKKWVITGNTFDGLGGVYGNTKFQAIVRFPNGGDGFVGEVTNNTFYNLAVVKGKDLFEAPQGNITVSKNIFTLDTSVTGAWTKGIGIKAAYTSTDNFIFDTTSSITGFTNADPAIANYVFLQNYTPTNAEVVAAGAGDPRWLK